MTASVESAAQAAGGSTIGEDVPCRGCGYNLRGLGREGRCPECGEGCAASVMRWEAEGREGISPIALASPRWVRKVAIGWWLVVASAVAEVAGTAGSLSGVENLLVMIPLGVLSLGGLASMAAGLWMVGSHEPGARKPEGRLRWAIRAGAILHVATVFGLLAVIMGVLGTMPWSTTILLQSVIAVALTWAGLMYAARLARRLGKRGLRVCLASLAWVFPAAMMARAVLLPDFALKENYMWLFAPSPMFGDFGHVVVLLPYSVAVWPRVDVELVGWVVSLGLGIVTLGAVVVMARGMWAAARANTNETWTR